MNMMRTAMLLATMTALFMGVGYLIGGTGGMMIAFLIAAGMNLFSYWNADKMVLRMHHAVEVDERNAPEYYGIVRDLAAQCRPADAEGLSDRQRAAQRLRHRPQSRRTPRSPPPPACCSASATRRSPPSWRTNSPMCRTATR